MKFRKPFNQILAVFLMLLGLFFLLTALLLTQAKTEAAPATFQYEVTFYDLGLDYEIRHYYNMAFIPAPGETVTIEGFPTPYTVRDRAWDHDAFQLSVTVYLQPQVEIQTIK